MAIAGLQELGAIRCDILISCHMLRKTIGTVQAIALRGSTAGPAKFMSHVPQEGYHAFTGTAGDGLYRWQL